MELTYRDDGSVALPGPHRFDPAFTGTLGHRRYAIGLDLGQARDPAAVSIIRDEQLPLPEYDPGGRQRLSERKLCVVHLERYRDRDYIDLARLCAALLRRPPLSPTTVRLVVDATGPGRPFCDVLREIAVPFTGIQITSGQGWSRGEPGLLNVSKSHLCYNLAGHLETRRLKVGRELRYARGLLTELSEFQADVSAAGNLLVNVRAADHHGDLAVATALALFALTTMHRGSFGVERLESWY